MELFDSHPEFYNKPIWISEKTDPLTTIKRFFEDYTLSEIRCILWEWFEVAVTSENDTYSEPEERANLLCQYHNIEILIEAAYILSNSYKKTL